VGKGDFEDGLRYGHGFFENNMPRYTLSNTRYNLSQLCQHHKLGNGWKIVLLVYTSSCVKRLVVDTVGAILLTSS